MPDPRIAAETALAALKDAFWHLDSVQREARQMLSNYQTYLPDRAGRSSLVPRHQDLDLRVDALVREYLSVLDLHPPSRRLRPAEAVKCLEACGVLEPRLRAMQAELQDFLKRCAPEFQRIGAMTTRIEGHKESARLSLQRAHAAWQRLREAGFDSTEADQALARARVIGRRVDSWVPVIGVESLGELDRQLKEFAQTVETVAREYPDRVARARNRLAALRTRLEGVANRAQTIPGDLRSLRREFSAGNWQDLEHLEGQFVEVLLDPARASLGKCEHAVLAQRWDEGLELITLTEAALDRADRAVSSPRKRLEVLRGFRDDSTARTKPVSFAIRDAQMLVMRGPLSLRSRYARNLDDLVIRLDAIGMDLQDVHPNYWQVLRELDAMLESVNGLVERFRTDVSDGAGPTNRLREPS